jgi:predicted metal-dependent hydrolase
VKQRTANLDAQQLALVFDEPGCPPASAPASSPAPSPAAASPSSPASALPPPAGGGAAPADPVSGERRRHIVLAGSAHTYRLRRGKRRTIGFQIDDNGLTVSAPRWVTLRDVESAIVEKERWIRGKLAQWRDWRARRQLPEVRWADGGELPYLGVRITLRLAAASTALEDGVGGRILRLALPGDANDAQVRDAVHAWLQGEARRVLGERLALLAQRIDAKPAGWSLSSARSQWGSCTHDRRIRLNWRLVHFALPVIDYVVAHELAHLKEMNHSPRFWSAVAQLLPGFEAARDEIRGVDLGSLPA